MVRRRETRQQADGNDAEGIALAYLEHRGLSCLGSNYRCRAGEIDLVMRDGNTVVITEVRYRENGVEDALYSIGYQKRQRIRRAALKFLNDHPMLAGQPFRFDVVAIGGQLTKPRVCWITDAFQDE